jgi:hypothetical protein
MRLEVTVHLYFLITFLRIDCGAGTDRQMQGSEIVWCIVVINDGC